MGAFTRRVRRGLTCLEETSEQRFLSYCANTPQAEISGVLSPDFKAALHGHSFQEDCPRHMETRGLSGLQRLQERDLSIYLPNHNLLYTDKMSMAVGLEARVPSAGKDPHSGKGAPPLSFFLNSGSLLVCSLL